MIPMLIIAIVSQKGGAGKTPTAIHLAFALMRAGYRVLFVDADPQGTASLHFYGVNYREVQPTLYNALITLEPIVPFIVNEKLHVLTAHDELSRAEVDLTQKQGYYYQVQLQRLLKKYKDYDIVVIDTPGSTASIFPTLALTTANVAIVPLKTEFASERANGDTMNLIEDIRGTQDEPGLNPKLITWGILPTQFEMNVIHHKDVLASMKDQYGDLVYPEPSRKTNKYNDATALCCDIRDLDPTLGDYWDRVSASVLEKVKAA